MPSSSRFNRIVTIERLTDIDDGQGGQTRIWSVIGQSYASATPVGGSASLIAGTLQQQQPWRIELPWRADITAQDRITADFLPAGFAVGIDSVNDTTGDARTLVILGTASKI